MSVWACGSGHAPTLRTSEPAAAAQRGSRSADAGSHWCGEDVSCRLVSPSRWTVRTRSAAASTVVVALCLVLAGARPAAGLVSVSGDLRAVHGRCPRRAGGRAAADRRCRRSRPVDAGDRQPGRCGPGHRSVRKTRRAVRGQSRRTAVDSLASRGSTEYIGHVEISPKTTSGSRRQASTLQTDRSRFWSARTASRSKMSSVTVAALLAIGGPIVIALVAFGTHRLVGAALRPVERIRARVSSITSGKLAERIPVPTADDEIARLAVTMNDMLDRLEAGQAAQRRFVSDASHELRSPLGDDHRRARSGSASSRAA